MFTSTKEREHHENFRHYLQHYSDLSRCYGSRNFCDLWNILLDRFFFYMFGRAHLLAKWVSYDAIKGALNAVNGVDFFHQSVNIYTHLNN